MLTSRHPGKLLVSGEFKTFSAINSVFIVSQTVRKKARKKKRAPATGN